MKQPFSTKIVSLLVLICSVSLSNAVNHTVKQGESLYALSKKYEVSIERIKFLNNLSENTINIGQVLVIRPETKEVPIEPVAPTPETKPETEPLPTPNAEMEPEKEPMIEPVELKVKPAGLDALSAKQRAIVRQQILLDRNGMGPGIIDGYMGNFTKTAYELAKVHRPNALNEAVPLLVEKSVPFEAFTYLNEDLPGTGKRPDFKAATKIQCLMMYKTSLEMLAERYHSSEALLEKLNQEVDFKLIKPNQKILVPNVAEFKIENFMTPEGKAVKYNYLRKTRRATRVDIDYGKKRIMVYHHSGKTGAVDELLAAFPVTTNIKKGPKSRRSIEYFAPAPPYMRKKTQLELKPGPNSPVGIVWARLGNGYGIHGTSDGAGNGYSNSSGCIRLSNWDMAIFVKLVPAKVDVNFLLDGMAMKPQSEPKKKLSDSGSIAGKN